VLLCCASWWPKAQAVGQGGEAPPPPSNLRHVFAGSIEPPPPCKCECGGEIQCEKGQWAYCECREGKCSGKCISDKNKPLDLAADVVTVILQEKHDEKDLRTSPKKYSQIIDMLLQGKVAKGRYHIIYESRDVHFSFTEQVISKLIAARNELNGDRDSVPPSSGR
jgi:hypothetical protein